MLGAAKATLEFQASLRPDNFQPTSPSRKSLKPPHGPSRHPPRSYPPRTPAERHRSRFGAVPGQAPNQTASGRSRILTSRGAQRSRPGPAGCPPVPTYNGGFRSDRRPGPTRVIGGSDRRPSRRAQACRLPHGRVGINGSGVATRPTVRGLRPRRASAVPYRPAPDARGTRPVPGVRDRPNLEHRRRYTCR